MSDDTERRQTHRISSILKNVGAVADSPTQTFSRRSKRISFSQVKNVKEFRTRRDNETIWGDSYEKSHSAAKDGSICNTSDQRTTNENKTVEPAPIIDLFADIEDEGEGDVEMEVSFHHSQSPTKLFNQTMFIDESETTPVTNCNFLDMSMVGNKRKTNETISVDKAVTDATKFVKIRKMNDENLEPGNWSNTILQHVTMNISSGDCRSGPFVNLNETRVYGADNDLSVDDLPQNTISTNKPLVSTLLRTDPGISKIFDKTSITTSDMTIDDQSMCSSISDISKPIGNKTHIYGACNVSARIDQTFAVRNPLEENNPFVENNPLVENNPMEWIECKKNDDSFRDISEFNDLPTDQPKFDNSRHRVLEDLTICMDIRFKDQSFSPEVHPNFLSTDGIEDLTISLDVDTNFKAEVDENASEVQSMKRSAILASANDLMTLGSAAPSTASPAHEKDDNKENLFGNASVLPPIDHDRLSRQNAYDATIKISEDMTLCSVVEEKGTGSQQQNAFSDSSAIVHDHQLVAATDFSFDNPLSSTRFVPSNKQTLNFSHSDTNIKANTSNVMFNYCPTLTARQSRDFRLAVSSQNNTDELCNLEPDKLKRRSDMKKLFLDVTQESCHDLLSETKMDLVASFADVTNECSMEVIPTENRSPITNKCLSIVGDFAAADDVTGKSDDTPAKTGTEQRCRKCLNCRKSFDGNKTSFLKLEPSEPLKLDFSMYDQFKGLASWKDVIEARKKREAARELQNQLLVDQSVEAPDIRFLWENKAKSNVKPQPVHKTEPLTCFPMRMDIKYLMRNKILTEYPQWKYFDNFIFIGAIALRNEKIPSIRIHIKFDPKGPMKADKLNMPLLFSRVFIEECPTYLKRISPSNFLKHKQALALLPLNLISILSDSDSIYKGLEEIDNHFQSASAKVDEVQQLTIESEAFFKMKERKCHIEHTIVDTKKYLFQEILIMLDKIETVGPRNVYFQPPCETTNEFRNLPVGLPFLRAFLLDPKSYLVPFLHG